MEEQFNAKDLIKTTSDGLQELVDELRNLRERQEAGGGNYNQTDVGNAERMADRYRDEIRWRCDTQSFVRRDAHHWRPATTKELVGLAVKMLKAQGHAALADLEPQARLLVQRFLAKSEARERLHAMVDLLPSVSDRIGDRTIMWDRHPMLLGVANGVVDLETGGLRDGRAEDYITIATPVAFDPAAHCPRWRQFISEIFDGNDELIDFMHKAVGYSFSGDVSAQCFFFLHGMGANGKSTFLEVIRAVLGPYTIGVPFSTLLRQRHHTATNDVASTAGRRLVTASEMNEAEVLNAGRIKALTGGDTLTARFLYKENFDFTPQAKLWLVANYKPKIEDASEGMWRRVRLIPFAVSFKGREDERLKETLLAEADGILAWAIEGCLAWQRHGLRPPAIVMAATEEYRTESDAFRMFTRTVFVEDPGGRVQAKDGYRLLLAYDVQNGTRQFEHETVTSFGLKMASRYTKQHLKAGMFYVGISVNQSWFSHLDTPSVSTQQSEQKH
jgi:putative DNA primase/helicase